MATGTGRSRLDAVTSVAERAERGRALRASAPRSSHGEWAPAADRRDPVDVLEEQAADRVPELVPIRYGRMLTSPFAFYRGAAAIMAGDLASTPTTGLRVQLCGDAHLANFGAFASPERRLVFSLNDFDETLPGPWEWDVKRLAASFAIAGRELGLGERARTDPVVTTVRAYREAMREFAGMRNLDVWYASLDVDEILARWGESAAKKTRAQIGDEAAKARTKDSLKAMSRLTRRIDGQVRIAGDPPLIVPIEDLATDVPAERLEEIMRGLLRSYRRTLPRERRALLDRYSYAHIARKVVGVGSVGTRAWIILLLGRDDDDPLFLQAKEAQASVLEAHLGPSVQRNHGQRVVEGQRVMQSASDILLGWDRIPEGLDGVSRDFYVRQLWDWKRSPDIERMPPRTLTAFAGVCGWTLARAHARSGDAIALAAYLGGGDAVDRAILAFAEAYADQNARDHRALADAVAAGRVTALEGV
jgi:uncharacterized protein (DUF2252 family)